MSSRQPSKIPTTPPDPSFSHLTRTDLEARITALETALTSESVTNSGLRVLNDQANTKLATQTSLLATQDAKLADLSHNLRLKNAMFHMQKTAVHKLRDRVATLEAAQAEDDYIALQQQFSAYIMRAVTRRGEKDDRIEELEKQLEDKEVVIEDYMLLVALLQRKIERLEGREVPPATYRKVLPHEMAEREGREAAQGGAEEEPTLVMRLETTRGERSAGVEQGPRDGRTVRFAALEGPWM
ncbi:hypothetical protein C1H76_2498 [Elsinoe australis]|uniref:Uncharacterized protein n=1 Tax=Elsinoe australis TaxID=40998 RepID=A0A4U7B683_9PEZI|nr:hypothetical protein C1H76_2498 [Elsinoe australis]